MIEPLATGAASASTPVDYGWVAGVAVTLAFGAWNFIFHSKVASVSKLWEWKDSFVKEAAANRLSDAKEYASRAELTTLLSAMEVRIEKKLDEIKDLIGDQHGKR